VEWLVVLNACQTSPENSLGIDLSQFQGGKVVLRVCVPSLVLVILWEGVGNTHIPYTHLALKQLSCPASEASHRGLTVDHACGKVLWKMSLHIPCQASTMWLPCWDGS